MVGKLRLFGYFSATFSKVSLHYWRRRTGVDKEPHVANELQFESNEQYKLKLIAI